MESRTSEGLEVVEESSIGRKGSMEEINAAMINHAREIAQEIRATAVLAYVDVIKSRESMESLLKGSRCILAVRKEDVMDDLATMEGPEDRVIQVPYMDLPRVSQIKVVAVLALSKGLIRSGDRLVCLSGLLSYRISDNLTVMDVDREFEILSSKTLDIASQMGLPHIFDRALREIAEGKVYFEVAEAEELEPPDESIARPEGEKEEDSDRAAGEG